MLQKQSLQHGNQPLELADIEAQAGNPRLKYSIVMLASAALYACVLAFAKSGGI